MSHRSERPRRLPLVWGAVATATLAVTVMGCGSGSARVDSGQPAPITQAAEIVATSMPPSSRLSGDQLFLLDPPPEGTVLVHDSYWGGTQADGSWYTQMYAAPTARDQVAVVVTLRLTPVKADNPTDGIGREDETVVEPANEVLDGAPVYQTSTEDGWRSITWRDPSGLRFFIASRDYDLPKLLALAETLRPATKDQVQKAIVPYDPTRPRTEQLSGAIEDVPPPPLVPEEPPPGQEQG